MSGERAPTFFLILGWRRLCSFKVNAHLNAFGWHNTISTFPGLLILPPVYLPAAPMGAWCSSRLNNKEGKYFQFGFMF